MFLHTNPKKIFNLQSTYTFSAKYENFLSLALSQAMCLGRYFSVDFDIDFAMDDFQQIVKTKRDQISKSIFKVWI